MKNKFFLTIAITVSLASCGFSPIYTGTSKQVIISKSEIVGDKDLAFNLEQKLNFKKDEKKIKIIEELTKAVVESIVSTPMNNIRKASEQGQADICRADVIEVTNFFRHQCRIFILKNMLEQWNNDDYTVSYYRVTKQDNVCKWTNENLS